MRSFDGRIGHLEGITEPWANGGGVIRTIDLVEDMAKTQVGSIERGSEGIEARLGLAVDPKHPELGSQFKVHTYDPDTGLTGNAYSMPSSPIDVWITEIPECVRIAEAYNKKFIQNVGVVGEDPIAEARELVSRSYEAGAHAVLLNPDCPSLFDEDGQRKEQYSRDPEALGRLLDSLQPVVEKYMPIFLRIAPQLTPQRMAAVCRVIRDSKVVSALYVPNTWPNYAPVNEQGEYILQVPDGIGGKSGPGMRKEAMLETGWAVSSLGQLGCWDIDIVSSSGITNGKELRIRTAMSINGSRCAKAGCGSTFYFESKDWVGDTERLIAEYKTSDNW